MNFKILTLTFLLAGTFASADIFTLPSEPLVLAPKASQITLTVDNTISINDVFYGDTVANVTATAKEMDSRIPSGDPIYLVINSPGGSIDDGLELISNLSALSRPVKTITIRSVSMGFQTVQGLGERLILKTGTLMSHKARGGFSGEFPGQFDSRYAYYLKRVLKMDATAVLRTKGKFTAESYASAISTELWCDGDECVDKGLADRVVTASCDKSLSGGHVVSLLQDLMQGHTVEVLALQDECPLNTNPLAYTILLDGQPLFRSMSSRSRLLEGLVNNQSNKANSTSYGPNPYSSESFFSSNAFGKPSLTSEELNNIKKRVDEIVNKYNNKKEILRGY